MIVLFNKNDFTLAMAYGLVLKPNLKVKEEKGENYFSPVQSIVRKGEYVGFES